MVDGDGFPVVTGPLRSVFTFLRTLPGQSKVLDVELLTAASGWTIALICPIP